MLRVVFARMCGNKKKFISEAIGKSVLNNGRRVLFLVPEQSSFETEKELYISLGDRIFSHVEVVSFTRLCTLIKTQISQKKPALKKLSRAGKIILSSRAVENAQQSLSVYSGQASSTAFAQKISSVIDELKAAGIKPAEFENRIKTIMENESLGAKLSDVANIYNWYDALLKNSYEDPSDELSIACETLGTGSFFKEYDIIIDEFASFNSTQLEMLGKMISQSPSVTLMICSKIPENNRCAAVFKTPDDTFGKIKRLAVKYAAELIVTTLNEDSGAYDSKQLAQLERLACAEKTDFSKGDGIFVCAAITAKSECRYVASEISRLVREEEYRYKDIAVVTRDAENYLPYIEDSFRIFSIPFFCDMRASLDTRPIAVIIISLLEAIVSDFDPARIVSYIKCAVSPISADDAALIESYIEMWGISKSEIVRKFEKNPEGLNGDENEKAMEKLKLLNEIREKVVTPVTELYNKLKGASGDEITRCIYKFLQDNGIIENLSTYTNKLAETDNALASEQYRAFETCVGVMSQLSQLLGKSRVSIKRYLELFKMALNAEDVGSIPHHLDEVLFGDAGRVRLCRPKAVFLVGMNEGMFPKSHSEDGIFSDSDRKTIRAAQLDILTPSEVMRQNEGYYLYTALTAAKSRVYMSFCRKSRKGEPIFCSKIVNTVKKSFDIQEKDISQLPASAFFGTDESAFEQLCLTYNENSAMQSSLREYFMCKENKLYRSKILNIDKSFGIKHTLINASTAQKLYGKELMISPTQMERYYLCRFSHFCKYGLSLKPQKKAEVTALDTGNAIHEVLEKLLAQYTKDEIAAFNGKKLSETVEELLYNFISLKMGTSALENNRTKYSIMRLKTTIVPVVKFIIGELEESGFTPGDFELEIKKGKEIEPFFVETQDGTRIGVFGKVDRIDLKKTQDKTYVRVIDYKSGGKSFSRNELYYGLNLQMFLYLFSIWKNGGKHYGANLTPSGVLYVPAKRPDVKVRGNDDSDTVRTMQKKEFRMDGLLLDDPDVKTDRSRDFYSAQQENISEFESIKNQTEKLLCSMAGELRLGELAVNPLYDGRENKACKFCDYRMVCGFEEGDAHRTMQETPEKSEVQENE